ncbi:hypothetical protein L4X63_04895 [Geomonas sp. Red32]|uniref:hypothetical protein n=1 Tax=Geomonas sp. Red32 TaxID=2912856 RepID=UPI00202CE81A|nr:hypothetical protein [Geomonas sp. Red32]MCM0080921.1 hypothetical protein [Geomonas sp. Red32]
MHLTLPHTLLAGGGASWHHFAGILLVIILCTWQVQLGRVGPIWMILWSLPGTILHELSHLVVALVTGGRPVGFSIFPRPGGGSGLSQRWVLGSVTISRPSPVSALPTALAPLALLAVSFYLYEHWWNWFGPGLLHTLGMYVTVYLFSYSSIPSHEDFKLAASQPLGILLYGSLAALLVYFSAKGV